jgi:hypothetical protein
VRRLSATPLGAKKINKKIILLLFLVVFSLIILLTIIHKHNNIGMSLSTLSVKKENRTNNLIIIMNIDYYKNIPVDIFQLIPTPESEIEEKIKNNELL